MTDPLMIMLMFLILKWAVVPQEGSEFSVINFKDHLIVNTIKKLPFSYFKYSL